MDRITEAYMGIIFESNAESEVASINNAIKNNDLDALISNPLIKSLCKELNVDVDKLQEAKKTVSESKEVAEELPPEFNKETIAAIEKEVARQLKIALKEYDDEKEKQRKQENRKSLCLKLLKSAGAKTFQQLVNIIVAIAVCTAIVKHCNPFEVNINDAVKQIETYEKQYEEKKSDGTLTTKDVIEGVALGVKGTAAGIAQPLESLKHLGDKAEEAGYNFGDSKDETNLEKFGRGMKETARMMKGGIKNVFSKK